MEDTIIEELHKFREEWAARFNYDLHAMVDDLRRSQREENRQVISLPPRLVSGINEPDDAEEPAEQKNYREQHNLIADMQ